MTNTFSFGWLGNFNGLSGLRKSPLTIWVWLFGPQNDISSKVVHTFNLLGFLSEFILLPSKGNVISFAHFVLFNWWDKTWNLKVTIKARWGCGDDDTKAYHPLFATDNFGFEKSSQFILISFFLGGVVDTYFLLRELHNEEWWTFFIDFFFFFLDSKLSFFQVMHYLVHVNVIY